MKFKPKVILTVGISNSGKSTWARNLIKENPMMVDLNRDDMRIAFFCDGKRENYNSYKFTDDKEKFITEVILMRAERALSNGQGIVISDTNLNGKARQTWKDLAAKHKVEYEEQVFDVPLHICMSRNRKRDITLPDRVLRQQYDSFRKFKGAPVYTREPEAVKAVICDLDGTLLHMNGRGPFEYGKVSTDVVDPVVLSILKSLPSDVKIIFLSGRESVGECYADSLKSIEDAGLIVEKLLLRKQGDDRPDVLVKEEFFWNECASYDILYALDDRNQIVDLWRALGIKCLQVGYGDF